MATPEAPKPQPQSQAERQAQNVDDLLAAQTIKENLQKTAKEAPGTLVRETRQKRARRAETRKGKKTP